MSQKRLTDQQTGLRREIILIGLLILFLVLITQGFILSGKVIQVQVVIPPRLLPYYDWLIAFPGIKLPQEAPAPEDHPHFQTSHA